MTAKWCRTLNKITNKKTAEPPLKKDDPAVKLKSYSISALYSFTASSNMSYDFNN